MYIVEIYICEPIMHLVIWNKLKLEPTYIVLFTWTDFDLLWYDLA